MESIDFVVWQFEQSEDFAKLRLELFENDAETAWAVELFTDDESGSYHCLAKASFDDYEKARNYFNKLVLMGDLLMNVSAGLPAEHLMGDLKDGEV